jgi:hypothetical protein
MPIRSARSRLLGGYAALQTARKARRSAFLSAVVQRLGQGGTSRHRVRSISGSGVSIGRAGEFQVGETLVVSVGHLGAVRATVRWVANGAAGLGFHKPIDVHSPDGGAE